MIFFTAGSKKNSVDLNCEMMFHLEYPISLYAKERNMVAFCCNLCVDVDFKIMLEVYMFNKNSGEIVRRSENV